MIVKDGQRFVKEPVYLEPKIVTALEREIASAFGRKTKLKPILVRHLKVRLKWMRPDGRGGFVPR